MSTQLPTFLIEVAFKNNPGDTSLTWTDIHNDVIDFQTSWGRQHELDRIEASNIRITLDNRSGNYSPWNTGSPYYVAPVTTTGASVSINSTVIHVPTAVSSVALTGSLVTGQGLPATGARITGASVGAIATDLPAITTKAGASITINQGYGLEVRKPVRVLATWSGVTYPVFYGYVDSWEPQPQDALNENCILTATDGLKLLSLRYMNNPGLYSNLVLSHSPTLYWRMGELADTTVCADSSGNNRSGLIGGAIAQRGENGLILYDPTTSTTLADQNGADSWVTASFTPGNNISFQMRLTTTQVVPAGLFASLAQFPFGVAAGSFYATSLLMDHNGAVILANGPQSSLFPGLGQTVNLASVARINDGNPHTITVTVNQNSNPIWTLYIDGNSQGSYTDSSGHGFWEFAFSGGSGTNIALTVGAVQYFGASPIFWGTSGNSGITVQDIAVFPSTLSAPNVASMHTTANLLQPVESTGQRIQDVLMVGGFGAWPGSLAVGSATCQGETQSTIQTSCLDYILNTNDTENGIFFQDLTGEFWFYDRHYVMTNATSMTSQGTYGDNIGTSFHYEVQSLSISTDDLDLWTDVQVQRNSGSTATTAVVATSASGRPQESPNPETQALLGYSSLQRSSTIFEDDEHALLLADWLRFLYSIPKSRVSSLMLTGQANGGANFPQMLGRQLLDRVTVQRMSPGTTTQFAQDAVVEWVGHMVRADPGEWQTTIKMSPFEIVSNPFILNTSTTDGPAVLVG